MVKMVHPSVKGPHNLQFTYYCHGNCTAIMYSTRHFTYMYVYYDCMSLSFFLCNLFNNVVHVWTTVLLADENMNTQHQWNDRENPLYLGEKTYPSAILSTTNCTGCSLEWNLSSHSQQPVTNCLSHAPDQLSWSGNISCQWHNYMKCNS
jgi:hypothetical protein